MASKINPVVKRKALPHRGKYPFYDLKKVGTYLFIPRADPGLVRGASISYQRYHLDIAAAGHKLIVRAETVEGVAGAGVYRVLKDAR